MFFHKKEIDVFYPKKKVFVIGDLCHNVNAKTRVKIYKTNNLKIT